MIPQELCQSSLAAGITLTKSSAPTFKIQHLKFKITIICPATLVLIPTINHHTLNANRQTPNSKLKTPNSKPQTQIAKQLNNKQIPVKSIIHVILRIE